MQRLAALERKRDPLRHGTLAVMLDALEDLREGPRSVLGPGLLNEAVPRAHERLAELAEQLLRDLADGLGLASQLAKVVTVADLATTEAQAGVELAAARSDDLHL